MITLRDLEAVRQYLERVRGRGLVTDLKIVKVTAYLDRHYPVRNLESFYALKYKSETETCYRIQGAGFLYKKFDGFLMQGPEDTNSGVPIPYTITFGSRSGEHVGIAPLHFYQGIGLVRMAGLVLSSRVYPETPLVPSGNQVEACRVARVALYTGHQDSLGAPCAYSGTAACRGWEKPPPCPRCGYQGAETLLPLKGDVDAALATLREIGIVYW